MKKITTIGLLIVFAATLGCGEDRSTPTTPVKKGGSGPTIGAEAPEITGLDLDGVEFNLSDYRGKVVLLDFWGDW